METCTGLLDCVLPEGTYLRIPNQVLSFEEVNVVFRHLEKQHRECAKHPHISWTQIQDRYIPLDRQVHHVTDQEPLCSMSWILTLPHDTKVLRIYRRHVTEQTIALLVHRCREIECLHVENASQLSQEGIVSIAYRLRYLQHLSLNDCIHLGREAINTFINASLRLKTLCLVGCNGVDSVILSRLVSSMPSMDCAYVSVK
uniref:Uncharacterized protein n=1 Tax=Ixodes ricinus TaxID=34613 RepID=A0A0K8R8A5_IXORI